MSSKYTSRLTPLSVASSLPRALSSSSVVSAAPIRPVEPDTFSYGSSVCLSLFVWCTSTIATPYFSATAFMLRMKL